MPMDDRERRRLNKQLAPLGRRICSCCGAQCDLADFPTTGRIHGRVYPKSNCKLCDAMLRRERYHRDPVWRAKRRAQDAACYARHPTRSRALSLKRVTRWRVRRKRARYAALLRAITHE